MSTTTDKLTAAREAAEKAKAERIGRGETTPAPGTVQARLEAGVIEIEEKESDILREELERQKELMVQMAAALEQAKKEAEVAKRRLAEQANNSGVAGGGFKPVAMSTASSPNNSPRLQIPTYSAMDSSKPKLSAVEPAELKYEQAGKKEVLDEWIFKSGKMLMQQGTVAADISVITNTVSMYWDSKMDRWWTGILERKKAEREQVQGWNGMMNELRTYFITTGDEETAVIELRSLKMKESETMEAYVQRAAAIISRISMVRSPVEISAEHVFLGVGAQRFPLLVAAITAEQRKHRAGHGGLGMTLNVMNNRLVELSQAEPGELQRRTQSTNLGGQPIKPPARWQQRQQTTTPTTLTQKLNAIGINLEAASSASTAAQPEQQVTLTTEEIRQLLNAVGTSSDKKWPCGRCRKTGHTTRECRALDTRTCYNCGETGHIRPNCQKPKKETASSSGAEGEKSKNE